MVHYMVHHMVHHMVHYMVRYMMRYTRTRTAASRSGILRARYKEVAFVGAVATFVVLWNTLAAGFAAREHCRRLLPPPTACGRRLPPTAYCRRLPPAAAACCRRLLPLPATPAALWSQGFGPGPLYALQGSAPRHSRVA